MRMEKFIGADVCQNQTHENAPDEAQLDTERYPYARSIGALRYLLDSKRQDLDFILGFLAQNTGNPTRQQDSSLKNLSIPQKLFDLWIFLPINVVNSFSPV